MPARSGRARHRALRRRPSALSVGREIDAQDRGHFFLKVDELLGERELGLEPRRTLLELGDALVLRVQLGLAAGLAPRQRLAAVKHELLAPCRQVGTVDALAAEQRLDIAALRAGCRLPNDPQLLGRGERSPL